jgi:hypothetical protein
MGTLVKDARGAVNFGITPTETQTVGGSRSPRRRQIVEKRRSSAKLSKALKIWRTMATPLKRRFAG